MTVCIVIRVLKCRKKIGSFTNKLKRPITVDQMLQPCVQPCNSFDSTNYLYIQRNNYFDSTNYLYVQRNKYFDLTNYLYIRRNNYLHIKPKNYLYIQRKNYWYGQRKNPPSYMTFWSPGHLANAKPYIGTSTISMASKFGIVVTWGGGTQPSKSRDFFTTWSRDKFKKPKSALSQYLWLSNLAGW